MGLKQTLLAARSAVHAAWHNANTRLEQYGVPPVPTLGALPQALDAVYASGTETGEHTGTQAAYDVFWDAFQNGGNRTGYTQAFAYAWSADTFKPKYSMRPTNATGMFNQSRIRGDLGELLKAAGVTLDFSGIQSNLSSDMFYSSSFSALPTIDLTSTTKLVNTFAYSRLLESVELVKLKDDGTTTFINPFSTVPALKELRFSGVIGTTLSLSSAVGLSRASVENILGCLSDTSTDARLTLSQAAVDAAFDDDEWQTLVASKPSWTIALA